MSDTPFSRKTDEKKPMIEFWKASLLAALAGGALGAFLALIGA